MRSLPHCQKPLSGSAAIPGSLSCQALLVEATCQEWPREHRDWCRELESVKCCISSGGSRDACCETASATTQVQLPCRVPLTRNALNLARSVNPAIPCRPEALELACKDCTGEHCADCVEEEAAKCCISEGGSRDLCCEYASQRVKGLPFCRFPADEYVAKYCVPGIVQAACQECSADNSCAVCHEEQDVKCCLGDGGSQGACCAGASATTQGRAVCEPTVDKSEHGPMTCSPKTVMAACAGLDGLSLCYDEAYLACCIRELGTDACCREASPELQAKAACQSIVPILP